VKSPGDIERELKHLIIETLLLEDVSPEEIGSSDPLFGEGLGLDSIDALELSMAIAKKYEIGMDSKPEESRNIYRTVATLAEHIRCQLARETPDS